MKKLLGVLLLAWASNSIACDYYVVGFKGKNGAFDTKAFNDYVGKNCSRLYSAEQTKEAVNFINHITVPYELYGFSLGAQSVRTVLKNAYIRPVFVLTIGAYHTVDVNFDRYGVKYKNYFDASGWNQTSPGIKVLNVHHMDLQKYVTREMRK